MHLFLREDVTGCYHPEELPENYSGNKSYTWTEVIAEDSIVHMERRHYCEGFRTVTPKSFSTGTPGFLILNVENISDALSIEDLEEDILFGTDKFKVVAITHMAHAHDYAHLLIGTTWHKYNGLNWRTGNFIQWVEVVQLESLQHLYCIRC